MTAKNDIRDDVRERYGSVAREGTSCCGAAAPDRSKHALEIGYREDELAAIPDDANLGLGCGNPTALAALEPGDVVLDLGSGAGMDAFLAASRVTETGRVIGVDMTREMLGRARRNAVERGVEDFVEFREGYIEDLPVSSNSVDVIISNCVINLSPNKEEVFREAFRVLKPGGRLAVSDICLTRELPEKIAADVAAYSACIGGAALFDDYVAAMKAAGFEEVEWNRSSAAPVIDAAAADPVLRDAVEHLDDATLDDLRESVWSYKITARKR